MTSVKLRGEGNAVWEFDLPLSEVFADQVRNRQLVAIDEENHALIADLLDPTAAAPKAEEGQPKPDTEPEAKTLDEMNLGELLEQAEKAGLPAEQIDGFRKPGTSKDVVRQAIAAHGAQQ